MRPAAQRLDADDIAEMIGLRLVDDGDVLDVDGFAQAGFQRLAQLDGGVHLDFEEGVLAAALVLGAIEGEVGLAQGFGGLDVAVVDQGDANRARREDLAAFEIDRAGQAVEHALGQGGRAVAVGIGLDDDEFVAAETGQGVAGTDHGADPGGVVTDQFVAGQVAERVVDVLEAVEADAHDGDMAALAGQPLGRLVQAVGEQGAVGQAGQAVVQRHMLGLGFAGDQALRRLLALVQQDKSDQAEAERDHQHRTERADEERAAGRIRHPGQFGDGVAVVIPEGDRGGAVVADFARRQHVDAGHHVALRQGDQFGVGKLVRADGDIGLVGHQRRIVGRRLQVAGADDVDMAVDGDQLAGVVAVGIERQALGDARVIALAQLADHALCLPGQAGEAGGIGLLAVAVGEDDAALVVDQQVGLEIEIVLEEGADVGGHPMLVVLDLGLGDGVVPDGDGSHQQGMIVSHLVEAELDQLFLARPGHVVGLVGPHPQRAHQRAHGDGHDKGHGRQKFQFTRSTFHQTLILR